MGKESFRSLRFHLRIWRIVQRKNREIRRRDVLIRELQEERDAIVRKLRRQIFFLEHRIPVSELKEKGVPIHDRAPRAQRAGH
ncbi:MAG: hypothetical protein A2735_00955 [Candidatus Yanofskybacteria bacterium RIFCSPHIGHO2_01_FULL_41_21]|uniref:Uncharacterized protein n=1 Tax=Candidatus Yanofskybacteria bacterium RIFCSPHIGHO2_01_FULL_41_21 TaxID=1802660 RepID=A0A1F8ECX0_9BACT|nr:MAG: hypothetical protein A2735_00955 [Candidatus Yanofskybacteria bacterium RIFCSPHIGHO2_01_FULL_41_21]